ncbi:MAG: AAA family ATPase [Gammaproteobacteria bacterium]|nr:AAA family ATPase [Gammaproteobacteria bacterium]
MESMHDLEVLISSGRRLIILETEREGCFIEGFRRIADRSERAYFQWTVTQGLLRLAPGFETQVINKDINQLFAQIQSTQRAGVYILVDFHHYLEDPVALRHIKDVLIHSTQHTLVLLSPSISVPDELRASATHFRLPLPSDDELREMVSDLTAEWFRDKQSKLKVADKAVLKRLLAGLCGLSMEDARRITRHAIFNDGIIDQNDIADVAKRKFDLLNKNNVLNLELDYAELEEIAGFHYLKQWLELRRKVFSGAVRLPGGDKPKGMLLLGIQGCGKSLAAKAVAGSWGLPLLHLDFGTLYNRFYGQTEENLRNALTTAEKMQPCILWLDEVEKGMSAVSVNDDVSKRLLATFLTWLAEKKESVFVVATANNVRALPPELLRKGRFDEVFFVDLPDRKTRESIFNIHLRRREQDPGKIDAATLAKQCEGFSGAEIESLVVSAMYHTYQRETEISTELLVELINQTEPLSVLMSESVQALRQWALQRAVKV